ncbi:hypothetical protein GCM10009840_23160 [Pseudolysinimonas kribbensis]|uniref:DUF805 domain-containing protein n=1 Tax=Pseudolysinimonas kribbensis TaxID=433641 RepID=A0ABQ6KEB1_9MICO|nr:DUF805 domain-containing protein [Pseudolysinimonas kribbensis]GMA96940.1 hypothetical protein GCM10025881_37640 [Pseudolysinimonas kribbensis]
MMTFPTAITTVFRKYADFSGRAARPEFWWFALFGALVSAALNSLNVLTPEGTVYLGSSLSGLWGLATLLPMLAVTVRRLRDAGFGWGHIFWVLLPVAGVVVLVVLLAQRSTAAAAPTGVPRAPTAAAAG